MKVYVLKILFCIFKSQFCDKHLSLLWLRMLLKFIVLVVLLVPIVIRSGDLNKEVLKDLKRPENIDEEKKENFQPLSEDRSGLTLINTVTFTSEVHIIAKFRH